MISLTCSQIYLHHMSGNILLLCNGPCYLYLSYFYPFIFLAPKDRILIQTLLQMQIHTPPCVLLYLWSSNKLALYISDQCHKTGMHARKIIQKHFIYWRRNYCKQFFRHLCKVSITAKTFLLKAWTR